MQPTLTSIERTRPFRGAQRLHANAAEPLGAFPFFRSQDPDESRQMVSRVFCPHDLRQVDQHTPFASRHNMVRLAETALNYLAYGAEVEIDPGCLGNFYLVQLPLSGSAEISCGAQRVHASQDTASILNPDVPTRMRWHRDATKLMLWIPREALERRLAEHLGEPAGGSLSFELAIPSRHGLTQSWCRLLWDLAHNIDHCGSEWLNFRPTVAALEDCLLRGLLQLHRHNYSDRLRRRDDEALPRHVQRAVDYMREHIEDPLTVGDIARAACISVRALEQGFKRHCNTTPLAWLREQRLERVHHVLSRQGLDSEPITTIAYRHGFAHLGRFAGYYRERFGETPSQTAARAARR